MLLDNRTLMGRLGQVLLQIICHGEALYLLGAEDTIHHLLVWRATLLVLRVLQVLVLHVSPRHLGNLRPGDLLSPGSSRHLS